MRYFLLLPGLLTLWAAGPAQAQTFETSVHLTGGGFNFRGNSAVRETVLISVRTADNDGYTNNPYGARPGFSYGAALQLQRVTKSRLLLGLQAGYERLRSRVDLILIGGPWDDNLANIKGKTTLTNEFVNAHPFVGRRFGLGNVDLDLSAGADLGLLFYSREKGRATDENGRVYSVDQGRDQPALDARARLDLTAYYQRFGLALSYSHGLSNYRRDWVGGVNDAYAQVWRAGVVYRLQ
ncbi:hypothetical protein [Hymenobacter sp. CRA2]|uniref:hypothetical protein n=1 Tax=Hymenobacter sp. CRA2 TaxID=1955620 RepID=UPI00098F660C|nr:hypothetical protein [Hymenobacter sp. CRA2]OON69665.1 hypothetical protein B0919_06955 [Hymenobacter sp. CRA2]